MSGTGLGGLLDFKVKIGQLNCAGFVLVCVSSIVLSVLQSNP